jgi:hypothetical protein
MSNVIGQKTPTTSISYVLGALLFSDGVYCIAQLMRRRNFLRVFEFIAVFA